MKKEIKQFKKIIFVLATLFIMQNTAFNAVASEDTSSTQATQSSYFNRLKVWWKGLFPKQNHPEQAQQENTVEVLGTNKDLNGTNKQPLPPEIQSPTVSSEPSQAVSTTSSLSGLWNKVTQYFESTIATVKEDDSISIATQDVQSGLPKPPTQMDHPKTQKRFAIDTLLPMEPKKEVKKNLAYQNIIFKELNQKPKVPEKAFSMRAKANIIPIPTFPAVQRLSADERMLVFGIRDWIKHKDANAISKLHKLNLRTKDPSIRQKARAFMGWIFHENNLNALASILFTRALENHVNPDYNRAIVFELSRISHNTPSGKAFLELSTAAKILEEFTLEKNLTDRFEQKMKIDSIGFLNLALAERNFDIHKFNATRQYAHAVPKESSWNEQARFLASLSLIAKDESKTKLIQAGKELTELFRVVEDPEVFDANASTLGRIHFILGNYKAAHQYLSQVSRDTNMFIDAAVDNGWALLRHDKPNDAVGNMFSLHTPYFSGAYMPESYFVKSIGYQELCQFGDAYNSVRSYKFNYNKLLSAVINFNKKSKTPTKAYYSQLAQFLTGQSTEIPPLVIREIARHPEILNRLSVNSNLAKESKKLSKIFPKSYRSISSWAKNTISTVTSKNKVIVAKLLKEKMLNIEKDLRFLAGNLALLEYEIYAGASQNLTMQGAQNFALSDDAEKKKALQGAKEYWPYEDELWEDELNHFRSKIVNACAKKIAKQKS